MSTQRLLENVRVIDLSQYVPGPFATRQLADLGAEVIKIEPPSGDPMRHFMHGDSDTLSPVYRHLNRGKKICKLDLKTDSGRQRLSKLLASADILLESFRPGVLARLGFDRETLESINPTLIHCALSGYGQNGPYRFRAGHDINYCAGSSVLTRNGSAAQPLMCYPMLADHAGAMQASIAMLAALHGRKHSQTSSYLDISLLETSLSWQYLPLLADTSQRAEGMLNGGAACYNIYRCKDEQFISLGAIEAVFWKNFCTAMGQSEWVGRHFEPMPQTELIAEISDVIAAQNLSHWNELLNPVDCCYEALYFPEQLGRHEQLRSRKALLPSGPAYPAWINNCPVEINQHPIEISADQIGWGTSD